MKTIPIKTATATEQEQIIATIILAFATDPMARWSFAEPSAYLKHFPDFVRAMGGKAFAHDTAYYADDFSGAALWLPPDVHPPQEELMALAQSATPAHLQEEVFAVFEQMGRYHPTEPHWYLPMIGVDPTRQGSGYGSALMAHAVIQCDRSNQLAYLESSNPRNIPLYQRYGFEVLGTIQVGSSPPLSPMLRKPKPARQNSFS